MTRTEMPKHVRKSFVLTCGGCLLLLAIAYAVVVFHRDIHAALWLCQNRHLRSREAFTKWALSELKTTSGFVEAQKERTAEEVIYAIPSHSYVVLKSGEKLYFMTHNFHEEPDVMNIRVGDLSILRHKDAYYVSTDHACCGIIIRSMKESFDSLDDVLQNSGYKWSPLHVPSQSMNPGK